MERSASIRRVLSVGLIALPLCLVAASSAASAVRPSRAAAERAALRYLKAVEAIAFFPGATLGLKCGRRASKVVYFCKFEIEHEWVDIDGQLDVHFRSDGPLVIYRHRHCVPKQLDLCDSD